MKTQSIFQDDEQVQLALTAVLAEQSRYKAKLAELEPLLSPEAFRKAHHVALSQSTDPDEIARIAGNMPGIEGTPAELARRRAQALASEAKEKLANVVKKLLEAADISLEAQFAGAVEAERLFFAQFGLPREASSVSRRYASLRKQVACFREDIGRWANHGGATPNAFSGIIDMVQQGQLPAASAVPQAAVAVADDEANTETYE
jgi:hypothetical protein